MATTPESAFTTFSERITPSAADREKAAKHRESINNKLNSEFGLYRMFQSGSFSHGTGVKNYSDVDYFVSLKSSQPAVAGSILTSVRAKLIERFPLTTIRVSRPGVVIEFGGGYEKCEIIPAYAQSAIDDDMRFTVPGVTTEWMYSTPEKHLKFVNACNEKPARGKAKEFARLVKAWKYYRYVPISSFYLEMRAARYISEQTTVIFAYDLCYFLEGLVRHDLADMNDPTGSTGRIAACSSDASKTDALSKLNTAATRARNALEAHRAGKNADAFYYWDQLFNGQFPSYG